MNVAGLAVHAIGRIQADTFAVRSTRVVQHFVNVRRTEMLAWTTEFFDAAAVAHIGVANHQVRGLVFFMPGAGMIEVGKFVECKFAIALKWTDQMSFRATVSGQLSQPLHVHIARSGSSAIAQAASSGDLL